MHPVLFSCHDLSMEEEAMFAGNREQSFLKTLDGIRMSSKPWRQEESPYNTQRNRKATSLLPTLATMGQTFFWCDHHFPPNNNNNNKNLNIKQIADFLNSRPIANDQIIYKYGSVDPFCNHEAAVFHCSNQALEFAMNAHPTSLLIYTDSRSAIWTLGF